MILVTSELLGQFVNTLTADYKNSRYNRENLSQQVPMQTSLQLKTCSGFFIAFPKSTLNLEYFEKKKITLMALVLEKLLTAKQVAN